MSKRLNIGVDVDGCLANFTKAARNLCKVLFNGRPDDSLVQRGWGFDSLGMTAEEERLMWDTIDWQPNWWMDLEVLPHCHYLKPLCDKHRVIFITNRKDGTGWPVEEQTGQWLRQNFQLFSPNVVISGDKGAVAKGLDLHAMIDDRPKNVADVVRDFPKCDSYIYNATYNQDFVHPLRVANFDEFAKLFL